MPTNIQSILNPNGTTYDFIFRGDWNPNDGAFPTAAFNGDMYKVSVDGTYSGFFYKAGTFITYVDGSWYKQADPSHYLRQDNPHNVDQVQVGLDQVRNVSSYSQAEADAAFASAAQGALADTATQLGDNISTLTNDLNFIDASGAPIQTVAGRTGDVVLDATDISEVTNGDVQLALDAIREELADNDLLTWMGL